MNNSNRPIETSPLMKRILLAILVIILFILPLWARGMYESYSHLNIARAAVKNGNIPEAIEGYAKAVRWRGLFNPFGDRSQQELLELEKNLQGEERIRALKKLRSAIFVSRNIYQQEKGDPDLVREIDQQLELLGARKPAEIAPVTPFKFSFGFQILSQLGFWGWIAASVGLVWIGFTWDGAVRTLPFLLCATVVAALFAFWLTMLAMA